MPDIELRLIANNEQYVQGIKESQSAYQNFNNSVASGSKEQEEFIDGVVEGMRQEIQAIKDSEKAVTKTGSTFKTQLRAIKEELAKMETAGLAGSKRFREMSIQAGQLEDQIGDTAKQVRILSSDTKNLDAAMSVGQGLAGGFALAQGAMALFGGESENMQRQLVKLQGGLNLLNGMQQVAHTLNKDSAARVVLMANAQKVYNAVVGQSTGALKSFKLALAATGIGLLIIGLGLLIANWDKVKKSIQNVIGSQTELNKKIEQQTNAINNLTESYKRQNNVRSAENELLTAIGDNEDRIFENKRLNLIDEIELKKLTIENTRDQIQEQKNLLAEYAKEKGFFGTIWDGLTSTFGKGSNQIAATYAELNKGLADSETALKVLDKQMQILTVTEDKRVKTIKEKAAEKSLEAQTKLAKELADILKQLSDKAEDAKLSMLTGKDRINAEEELQLKSLEMLKKYAEDKTREESLALKKTVDQLKPLTKAQYQEIEDIKTSINLEADKKRDEFNKNELNKTTEHAGKIKDLQRKIDEDELELLGASETEKLELKKKFLIQDAILLEAKGDEESLLIAKNFRQQAGIIQDEIGKLAGKGSGFSLWKLIGLDPDSDEGKAGIEALKESSKIILDQVAQIMDAELRQAEQHTQLIEKKLGEAESALEKEKELQEQGLANNVDAKQREVAQLKIEREKALEEQKKAQRAQLILDTAMQISSLITATAGIWKSFAPLGPFGPALAIAATGLMFGTFAAAKVKAFQAINQDTELEQGGYGNASGIISGKRHAQGGERFLDHVEVEQGEAWGVFNRQATNKFGNLIPYIVDSMNNLQFPNLSVSQGRTVVNFDTKKMTSKLDSIDTGIRTLNENMSNQSEAFYAGRTKIIKINKNHTRIIHATN